MSHAWTVDEAVPSASRRDSHTDPIQNKTAGARGEYCNFSPKWQKMTERNSLVIATSLRFHWLKCVLLTLLLYFGSPSVQHPQAVHVIWPSLLRSKAWQTRSAATPPMPLLGKLLRSQWYSRKSFAVSEKKTWKGPNICDSHLLDSSLASFLRGTMVYRNTEKVILLLARKPHPARRLLAIPCQAPDEDPLQILGTQTTCNDQLHIFKHRSAWDDLITSQTVHLPCVSLRLGCVHRNAWRAPEAPPVP